MYNCNEIYCFNALIPQQIKIIFLEFFYCEKTLSYYQVVLLT